MTLVLQRETTEYVYIGITGSTVSGEVEVAFTTPDMRPAGGDWYSAEKIEDDTHALWDDAQGSGVEGDWYIARLVGEYQNNEVVLDPEDYQVWVRLTDDAERPVRIAPVVLEIQ